MKLHDCLSIVCSVACQLWSSKSKVNRKVGALHLKSRPSLVNGKAKPDAGGQTGRYRKESLQWGCWTRPRQGRSLRDGTLVSPAWQEGISLADHQNSECPRLDQAKPFCAVEEASGTGSEWAREEWQGRAQDVGGARKSQVLWATLKITLSVSGSWRKLLGRHPYSHSWRCMDSEFCRHKGETSRLTKE